MKYSKHLAYYIYKWEKNFCKKKRKEIIQVEIERWQICLDISLHEMGFSVSFHLANYPAIRLNENGVDVGYNMLLWILV